MSPQKGEVRAALEAWAPHGFIRKRDWPRPPRSRLIFINFLTLGTDFVICFTMVLFPGKYPTVVNQISSRR